MPEQHEYKVGDRVRVVELCPPTFNDYDVGDTAVVTEVINLWPGSVTLRVRWETARFKDTRVELDRCNSLYCEEVEPIVGD